jgi:HD superfamily phosphodiesterase
MSIIEKTIAFVKQKLQNAEGGHDWFHIERVYKNAILIAKKENCDQTVVQLGALLHDIADSKFHNGDETIGPKIAREFLESENVAQPTIQHITNIIERTRNRARCRQARCHRRHRHCSNIQLRRIQKSSTIQSRHCSKS